MRDFGPCERITRDPIKPFEQRRSKITFNNPVRNRIKEVDVECLHLEGKSCDGLLIELDNAEIEHFIELKGNKVFEGIKQIENTIKLISKDAKRLQKFAYISSTRSPHTDPTIERIKKKFRADYNSKLTINTGHLMITI